MSRAIGALPVFAASLLLGGCGTAEVFVQPATERIENVEVEDERIPVEGKLVEVDTVGTTLITWSFEGSRESEEVRGAEADDGEVWTVYASYVDTD